MRHSRLSVWTRVVIVTIAVVGSTAQAQSPPISTGTPVAITRAFLVRETSAPKPRGLSAMACLPASSSAATRLCLTVNDEERFAEWATFQTDPPSLTPTGKVVQLLTQTAKSGKTSVDTILGRQPSVSCPADKFEEFDGEGLVQSGSWFYVTGSHACTRKKGKFKPSTFLLARTRTSSAGTDVAADAVERSWRLADAIAASSLATHFGKAGDAGVGIEGLTAVGPHLIFGFRTPSRNGVATLLAANADSLFAPGNGPLDVVNMPIAEFPVALGPDAGVRDLAMLDDTRVLILSGPVSGKVATPFRLQVVTLPAGPWPKLSPTLTPTTLAEIRHPNPAAGRDGDGSPEVAKPEAVHLVGAGPTVIILHDNIDDAGPRLHRLIVP